MTPTNRLLAILVSTVALLFGAPAFLGGSADARADVTTSAPATDTAAPAPTSVQQDQRTDAARYAQREHTDAQVRHFKGGSVVLVMSGGAAVLLIVLLVLLI